MDDHHQQPIWPMVQGAANYAWNLIEEVWAMVWKPRSQAQAVTPSDGKERVEQPRREMQEVDKRFGATMASVM
jgi:hypothetical protein